MPDRTPASTLPVPAPRRAALTAVDPDDDEQLADQDVVGVGMVGFASSGAAHSHAWSSAGRCFDLPRPPAMVALCGRDRTGVARAASHLGWWSYETDWRRLVERADVDLVDVCTPVDSRAEIAVAALRAGKHVLCDPPLATTLAGAEAVCAVAEQASRHGVQAMVGLPYRRLPAVALARRLVAEGRLGTVRHVRAQYLQDWAVDPELPLGWRLQEDRAGSGALGELGAHVVDLAQHVLGSTVRSVSGLTETFVRERPLAEPDAPDGATGPVTVDDAALFLARFTSGAVGSFEATRCSAGRKNALRLELDGSEGSLVFDLESRDELHFHDHALDDGTAGFRRIRVPQPHNPYVDPWRSSGHGLGDEHSVTCQVVDLVQDVVAGRTPSPSFRDGLQLHRVLAAVQRSAEAGSWQDVLSGC